jgi:hypothetical protein
MNPQYFKATLMTVFHIKSTVGGNVSCWTSKQTIFAKYSKCLVEALRHKPEGRFPIVIGIFHCHNPGPGVYSGSNTNEYQGYFLDGKVGRYVGLATL